MASEEEVLGKAYDSRLMKRLLTYLRPYKWQVDGCFGFHLDQGRRRRARALSHQDRRRPISCPGARAAYARWIDS